MDMEATTILLICALGLTLLVAYLIYRINTYKKRIAPIRHISTEISTMDREDRRSPKKKTGPSIDTPVIPESELLVILHKENRKPWLKAVSSKLSEGRRGVIVTVKDPDTIRSRYRGDVRFIWLDRSTAHDLKEDMTVVNPTNLSKLLQEIEDTIEAEGIVLFNGFEEVLGANETSRVIRFLRMLNDSCSKKRYSSIIPANYRAVPQRVRVQLTESFESVVI